MCVHVCVCLHEYIVDVCVCARMRALAHTHTHMHVCEGVVVFFCLFEMFVVVRVFIVFVFDSCAGYSKENILFCNSLLICTVCFCWFFLTATD